MYKYFYTLVLLVLLAFTSCRPVLKVNNIKLNTEKGYYTYETNKQSLALRDFSGKLVLPDSLNRFLKELALRNMEYNVVALAENDLIISKFDMQLLALYNQIVQCYNAQNANCVIELANEFEKLYPAAIKYTDINFLRAGAYKIVGPDSLARVCLEQFIQYSEKKYSALFRQPESNNNADSIFIRQRRLAWQLLNSTGTVFIDSMEQRELIPKYYYQSFTPGYVLNKSDFGSKQRRIIGAGFAYNLNGGFMVGAGNHWLLNEKYTLNSTFATNGIMFRLRIAFNYQLYKSLNNRFALAVSPEFLVTQVLNNNFNYAPGIYYSPSFQASIGYHINQNLYLGAFAGVVVNNPLKFYTFLLSNRVQLSLNACAYYHLVKGISLRIGWLNRYPVCGLMFTTGFLGFANKSWVIGN